MFVYPMTVGPVATNCYLVGDESTHAAAIVDPGAHGQQIAEVVKKSEYQVDKILLTHTHFDHISGLSELLLALNAPDLPIYVHKSDYPGAEAGFGDKQSLEAYEQQIHFYDDGDTVPRSSTLPVTRPAASACWWRTACSPVTPCSAAAAAGPTCPPASPWICWPPCAAWPS